MHWRIWHPLSTIKNDVFLQIETLIEVNYLGAKRMQPIVNKLPLSLIVWEQKDPVKRRVAKGPERRQEIQGLP